MKRDIDLIRKLVFTIEEHPHGFAPNEINIDGYTSEQIGYHLYTMLDSGLIKGSDISTFDDDSPQAMVSSLTWKGHEFADAARSDRLWVKAKDTIADKTGAVTISLMFDYLQVIAKSAIGI